MRNVLVRQQVISVIFSLGPHSLKMSRLLMNMGGGLETFSLSKESVVQHGKFTWVLSQKVEQDIVWFCV